MPFPSRTGRMAIAAAGAATLVLALPGAAEAAHHKPVHKAFTAHGLVLRHTSSTVTLLASSAKSGKHRTKNTTLTVALPSRHTKAGRALARRLARTHAGDGIALTGTTTKGHVTAKNFATRPAPF